MIARRHSVNSPFWDAQARLLRSPDHGRGWRGPKSGPAEIMRGSLATLARHISDEDPEDLWRFAIVTAEDHYIRNAELRALLRREDRPSP